MRIRWSPEAAEDLERIVGRIQQKDRAAAQRVATTIFNGVRSLRAFPNRGRAGRFPGSRELVFSPLPYIAVYRIRGEVIEISRIHHGAQDRP
jgi:toxin ParE1/3/4